MRRSDVLNRPFTHSLSISISIIVALVLSHGMAEENFIKQSDYSSEVSTVQSNSNMEQSLENILDTMKNVSSMAELMGEAVINMQNFVSKVEALNSSLQLIISKVEGLGTELSNLQNLCRPAAATASKSSRKITHGLISTTTLRNSNTSKTVVEGYIVGASDGISTIALPSLQQTKIGNSLTYEIAFDWNSRKVYWMENGFDGIKRSNLDGTDLELWNIGTPMRLLAVDSITGNIYLKKVASPQHDVIVCRSKAGSVNCSVVVPSDHLITSFALYPSKSLMFWTNYTGLMRANMDGTDARVILSESNPSMAVDEHSERLYWLSQENIVSVDADGRSSLQLAPERSISSCDFNGDDRTVLWNTTEYVGAMEISGDLVYFSSYQGILSGSKGEGKLNVSATASRFSLLTTMALYGRKGHIRENPCEGSPCSHLCVLKLKSFACLCPQGQQLDHDGATCV